MVGKKMKKISYYILAFLLFILSLGTMSSCIDEDINIKEMELMHIFTMERDIYIRQKWKDI